jgi:Ca2+/Na+ antiporter
LLALGNGSPDLGSTINAILLWNEATDDTSNHTSGGGWTMSLGSLTGGGMFVGTIVSGLIVQSCNGIPCRGAFLRDVSMYAISILMVWHVLESQQVTRKDVWMLLGMWVGYVTVVLVADLYHRKVTLPRLHLEGKKRRETIKLEKLQRLSVLADNIAFGTKDIRDIDETTPLGDFPSYGLETDEALSADYNSDLALPRPRLSVTDRFAMLMSNYDPASVKFGALSKCSSAISNDDSDTTTIHNVMHQIHSIRRTSLAIPKEDLLFDSPQKNDLDDDEPAASERLYSFAEAIDEEESIVNDEEHRSCSAGLFVEAYHEVVFESGCYMDTHFVKEPSIFERFGFLLELPITIIRTVSTLTRFINI